MLNPCYADNEGLPIGKLDLQRRVSIALGASKGKLVLTVVFVKLWRKNTETNKSLKNQNYVLLFKDQSGLRIFSQKNNLSRYSILYSFGIQKG